MKETKRILLILLSVIGITARANAQESISDYRVIHEVDTVWNFGYKGVNLFSRSMHRIDIAYMSKDVDGSDIELSGYVCIPNDIYGDEQPCDGILLYNHYTQFSTAMAPTRGYATGEDFVMANPLKPNYIVVCSDFLGFGITEGRTQTFCYGDYNGQASIDCFLAARKLLDDRNISQGKFVINAGYSSGGYDAIATQRVRDLKYKDQITFHKTLCGGMPFDIIEAYRSFIQKKDDATMDATCPPLVLGIYNHHARLGYTNQQMFKEPFASKYDEWYMSGKYSNSEIMDSMKNTKLSDIIQDAFLDYNSEEYKNLKNAAKEHSLANGWKPDSTQAYYVFHLLRDNVVPVEGGRAFINYLSDYYYDGKKCNGYKRSIVPEHTRLQTNFFIPSESHTIAGGLVFFLNLAVTLSATPVLYYDGELNTHYADFVEPATLMGIIHLLEDNGYDVRGTVQNLMSGDDSAAGGDLFSFLAQMEQKLNSIGTSTTEVLQVALDSGVDFMDIYEVYTYLTTPVASAKAINADQEQTRELQTPFITGYYHKILTDWLRENKVNLDN